jgi:hypothetical protein
MRSSAHYQRKRMQQARTWPHGVPAKRQSREELRALADQAFNSGVAIQKIEPAERRDPLRANNEAHERAQARMRSAGYRLRGLR